MASEEDMTSDSLDASIADVPEIFLDHIRSSIVDYVNKRNFSAKIHRVEGRSPKLVVSFGQQDQTLPRTNDGLTDTNAIIVRNLPPSVDEELLEIFFESTKKQGGGPVKTVKLFSDEKFAIVEFCEPCSVETVLKKKPVRYGKTKLDIQPYKPLLRGAEKIYRVDLEGLMDGFSDDLLKKHIESLKVPDYGPELAAMMTVGSRVVRGKDWKDGYKDQDGSGEGTVAKVYIDGIVLVNWDNGKEYRYRMGKEGCYELKLA